MFNHQSAHPVDEPFNLNLNPDTLPDVSLEHDSTTNEVHIKFFNVDDEVVLDLWGQLDEVGPIITGLSTIAKYRALCTGLNKAVAKEDLADAIECFNALKSLQLTSEFGPVFENVEVKTNESPKKDPERHAEREQEPLLSESGIAVLTGEEAEALLAMLDKKFNGK